MNRLKLKLPKGKDAIGILAAGGLPMTAGAYYQRRAGNTSMELEALVLLTKELSDKDFRALAVELVTRERDSRIKRLRVQAAELRELTNASA